MTDADVPTVDAIESGSGPLVVLVHSSVAGARQWRRLISDLEDRYRVVAVNLLGYGKTSAWSTARRQTLDDQADLVTAVLPDDGEPLSLVGHSFGGSVAMKAAARLGPRVAKLVLLEPNPFYLLARHGRDEAYAECLALHDWIKRCGTKGDWAAAAARFADYWGGSDTWATMPADRRATFVEALKPNFHEWDGVLDEPTSLSDWVRDLPARTLVLSDPATVRPIREIVALLQQGCPAWRFVSLDGGGHMAPLTRPDLVNPIVASFLDED